MQILQIAALIACFMIMALLMFLRKLPALIALPVMAVAIALIGGVSPADTIQYVVGAGTLKLATAYTIAMLGSMLSVLLQKTGVAENFIKRGAELSGDNPWIIAVIMLLLITLLFTTLGGLGAIIMVAAIVLPIMTSVGIGPMTTVGIFLFGLSMGGLLNAGNWAVYLGVMGLSIDQIRPFALLMFAVSFITALIYITVQLYRDGHDLNLKRIAFFSLTGLIILGSSAYYYNAWCPPATKAVLCAGAGIAAAGLQWIAGIGTGALFLTAVLRILLRKNEASHDVHWTSFFAPAIPLFLILIFNVDIIAAFLAGFLYTFLATYRKGRLGTLVQSLFDGGAIAMPAVVLMFGIGMLLVAIMGPGVKLAAYPDGWPVLAILRPMMARIVPTNPWVYVLVFTAAAPLALYRGPLNVWGMGYGLAAVFLASGLNPGAVMGLLLGVGPIQGISDPTNTHNVWLANEMRVDVQKVLWNTIAYTWPLACVGLLCSAFIFM